MRLDEEDRGGRFKEVQDEGRGRQMATGGSCELDPRMVEVVITNIRGGEDS